VCMVAGNALDRPDPPPPEEEQPARRIAASAQAAQLFSQFLFISGTCPPYLP
jgi:hypothetical protein